MGFLAGVTNAIDEYHSVVAVLGERFVYLRVPDVDRETATRLALRQRQHDKELREERRAVVAQLIAGVDPAGAPDLSDAATTRLIELADFTTLARTHIARDGYSREVLTLPEPEAPMRFAKQLAALVGALRILGYDEAGALAVMQRLARDSVPPVRVVVLDHLRAAGRRSTSEVATELGLPSSTAARALEDLALLGILRRTKESDRPNATNWWEVP